MDNATMLKRMDKWLRKNIQDEELFMNWLYLMPDGATDADFEEFAEDMEFVNECARLFSKMVLLNK